MYFENIVLSGAVLITEVSETREGPRLSWSLSALLETRGDDDESSHDSNSKDLYDIGIWLLRSLILALKRWDKYTYIEAFTEIFRFSVHEFSQEFGKYSMKHKRYNHSKCICLCSACLIEGLCVWDAGSVCGWMCNVRLRGLDVCVCLCLTSVSMSVFVSMPVSVSVFLRSRSVEKCFREAALLSLLPPGWFSRLAHVPHTRRKSMRPNFRWLWTVLVSIRRFKSVIQILVLSKL